jgi:hypothetical protein
MKKTLLFFTIVIISITTSAQLAIKYTPIVFARNMKYTFHVEYLIPNTPRISLSLGLSQNSKPRWQIWNEDTLSNYGTALQLNAKNSQSGFSIDPEIRIYNGRSWTTSTGNMEGSYIGLYSSQRFSTVQLDEYALTYVDPTDSIYYYTTPTGGIQNLKTYIAVYGLQLGFQQSIAFDDRLMFDAYVGAGLKLISRTFDSGNNALIGGFESTFEKNIALRANVSLAWRFRRKA